jgi:excisionase family DNA binding protein
MNDFLTTRQLQDLLKVDRTTIYRMLKSGRLSGMKVGNQWRFPRDEVLNQLSARPVSRRNQDLPQTTISPAPVVTTVIPLPCVQAIQDVFAEMVNVGAVTIDTQGAPVTEISNCSRFCRLVLASKRGREDCMNFWRKLAATAANGAKEPEFIECHAGLQYACARIAVGEYPEVAIIAGQFYVRVPARGEQARHLGQLARACGINPDKLIKAAEDIPVLSDEAQPRIGDWLRRVAETFSQVGTDRAAYRDRLRQIAQMSIVDPA